MDRHTWHECDLQAPSCWAGHRCQVELPGSFLATICSLLSLWRPWCAMLLVTGNSFWIPVKYRAVSTLRS